MLWFGTDKARFKVQRRIAGVVLFIAIFFWPHSSKHGAQITPHLAMYWTASS